MVHPPFGKILIAGGRMGVRADPVRVAVRRAAVTGSLAILLLARIARRMTSSTLLGCVAGLLLALDGLEFVMSRTALLDIFVMFWVLAAFAALVVDRDRTRAGHAAGGGGGAAGRTAAACRGALVAAGGRGVPRAWRARRSGTGSGSCPRFAALTLAWDIGAPPRRRADRRPQHRRRGPRPGGLGRPFTVLPLLTYLATWTGWFATSTGYDRQWAAEHGIHTPVDRAAGARCSSTTRRCSPSTPG